MQYTLKPLTKLFNVYIFFFLFNVIGFGITTKNYHPFGGKGA